VYEPLLVHAAQNARQLVRNAQAARGIQPLRGDVQTLSGEILEHQGRLAVDITDFVDTDDSRCRKPSERLQLGLQPLLVLRVRVGLIE
jgi:hypothetical protein